ncbi:DUF5677 domain-containing protein [Sediminibacterium sp.]|uniref:DUF5677 domain-containing protein n=1 Tax=Sediminibacterium sp. TaxID=1917865 RepID=UPI0025F915BB|nr:DUF5677 domain-containing protein [Sediminibacterium sp.]
MEGNAANYLKDTNAITKNKKTISDKYKDIFISYFGYLSNGFTVYESIRKFTIDKKFENTDKVIIPFYGIMFRMADQIGTMLQHGYIDAALRLWRSLYEHSIVLLVFLKHYEDLDLFDRFSDHQYRSRQKRTMSFGKNFEALKWKPLDETILDDLDTKIKEINDRYGKEFLESEYGWAHALLPEKKKVTLRELEEHVGLNRFRPFYILTAEYVHPTYTSIDHFIEDNALYISRIVSQGFTFSSLIDPLQFTIGILDEVNIIFLEEYSSEEESPINYLIFRRVYERMMDEIGKMDNSDDKNLI